MAGVSTGTKTLLDALVLRAKTELGLPRSSSVGMRPGDEIVVPPGTPGPREHELRVGAAVLRDPVGATPLAAENVLGAVREVAFLAAHERCVQRGTMSRMRLLALYRNKLSGRIRHLEYGIPEGLVS